MKETATLKEYEKIKKQLENSPSVAEILGFASMLTPSVVMLKDGSLQAVFKYFGDDVQSVTDDVALGIALRFSEGISNYWTDNILIETDLIRKKAGKYSDSISFPDAVSALIDQERAWEFNSTDNIYESSVFLTITWLEPKEISAKAQNFMFDSDERVKDKTINERIGDFN